jgi:GntR family transcriptional regulator, arabinose operon transcriptional repressor
MVRQTRRTSKQKTTATLAKGREPQRQQVLDALLAEISSGRLRPGDRLPTEAALAKAFSASRSTVARAMRELKRRGLLDRQRGGGTHLARAHRKHDDATKNIALFTPWEKTAELLGYVGGQIFTHLSDLASQHANHLRLQFIRRTDGDCLEPMRAAARLLIEQGIQGVFYYPAELPPQTAHYNQLVVDELTAAGIAIVAVDRDIVAFPNRSRLPLVAFDNRRGGYLLTDHLIQQGCKRIAFIGSPLVSSAASDRLRGYCDALADHGLPVDPSLISRKSREQLDADFCRRLMNKSKPHAIVCKMDHYAAIIGRHLLAMGGSIGDELKIAGFDDQPFAEMLPVPLTTIRFPFELFARACYDRLLAQMSSPSTPDTWQSTVDIQLVVRQSTAPGSRAPGSRDLPSASSSTVAGCL